MTRSPILLLAEHIVRAPFNVAPEKATVCAQHRDNHRISIEIVDESEFRIRVRKSKIGDGHEIVLPIASLEYLWAFSHYSWVLTQEYRSEQVAGSTEFNCVGNTRLQESHYLLKWAERNLNNSGTDQWPETGPRPTQAASNEEDVTVATELFLCALAWIMQHEIGHVVLKHPFSIQTYSLQQEQEADRFATEWLLDGLDQHDPILKKRALGLAIAILCLQSLEVTSYRQGDTHPGAHERIFTNTAKYQCGDDEVVEAVCTVVLQYLFFQSGLTANINGDNFSEIMGDLLFDIARTKEEK